MNKFTLIAPIFNEWENIKNFLITIFNQTRIPDEIILVDWWSTDNTFDILKLEEKKHNNLKVFQLTWNNIKIWNIAKNRNLAIKNASNEIILCVDAGWIIDKNYCKYMMDSFEKNNYDVVGWNYKLIYNSDFQKNTNKILEPWKNFWIKDFNPSSRSIWFKKKVWESVGWYPEYLTLAWEDTYFNYLIRKKWFQTFFQEKAIVYWDWRESEQWLFNQIYFYNKWDAEVFIINWVILTKWFYYFILINFFIIIFFIFIFINIWINLLLIALLILYGFIFNFNKMKGNFIFRIKINLWKLFYLWIWYMSWILYWIKYLFNNW